MPFVPRRSIISLFLPQPPTMNPQVTNLGIMLFMMQANKKVPWELPETMLYVRVGYLVSNLLIFALYAYMYTGIVRKDDLTTLKYVEPPSAMSGESDKKLVTTTVKDYDLAQLKSAFTQGFLGIGMIGVMHVYFKMNQPLIIQSILPLKGVLETNLAKIHIWGSPATGDLKRPFKAAPGMFGGAAGGPSTDKKAVQEAEKTSRGGVKEE